MQNKVLLYIEQPPPMHGITYTNQIIYDSLKDEDEYVFFDTNFTFDVKEVGAVSYKKIIKNISIMIGAWRSFFQTKPSTVYSVLSATNFGMVRDFMINLPAILFRKRLVLHLHGFTYYKIYQESKLYKILFDIMSKNAKLIVLCERQKEVTLDVMNKESIVLHNCLNTNNIKKRKIKNKILQLCYISNISKEKGTFELVKAVQAYDKDIKLTIAGNFLNDKEEFLELIKNDKNISYIGFADENIKDEILSESDIFCLPSKLEEGSPVSIIEAMSHGLPILATNKGCIEEMIEDNGFLLNDNYAVRDIVEGIEFIEKNYNILSTTALEKYKQSYKKDKFIYDIKKVLR